ncbi:MAG: protein kinase, partial [Myxococcales bacterium]|nr:protein kinase [Myxococcales bacterium]
VADFGLARARGRVSRTQPGIIQGKFAYMSPELVRGHAVDRRADLFGVGIMLWEMLTGQRLFKADNDQETLRRVRDCQVPPLGRDAPPLVAAVIGRALAREPVDRFPTARAMHDALLDALPSDALRFTAFDLADLVAEVMPDAPPDVIAAPLFVDVPAQLVALLGQVDPTADLVDALAAGVTRLEAAEGITHDRRSGGDRRKRRRAGGGRRRTDRQAFVDRVLVLLDEGKTTRQVADQLNGEGLSTRSGGPWTPKAIAQLARRARARRRASGEDDSEV